MVLPVLAFMARMGLKHGGSKAIQMAIKKFGKKAVQKASTKTSYAGRNIAKKVKPKTYKDTKIHKQTSRIRKRLGIKNQAKKALEYSPPFMLRNLVRDALSKRVIRGRKPTKKKP